jgi:glutamate synthase domain-containing protein 2/glutamate synthase domain-containing protein 1/glutamate synthase domain-containing protein 3
MNRMLPLVKQGLYDPQFERDACGVGVVANITGVKSHRIIENGLEVLANLGHRGARGADPDTGDGAGILIQMPHSLFASEAPRVGIKLPPIGEYGVGMIFLPGKDSEKEYKSLIEKIVLEEGQAILGWRDVPVDSSQIGFWAREVEPRICQLFVGKGSGVSGTLQLERKLYIIRKRAERIVSELTMRSAEEFYIASFSTNRIVYKGLLVADQVGKFYLDLTNTNTESAFALVHSRFSTNTLGSWKLAHPYRLLCHNGEINTLRGNINWMAAREPLFSSKDFGDDLEKLYPIIPGRGQSDTACIDNALELLMYTGRSLPHSLMMLVPEAWSETTPMSQDKRDFYEYHSSMMEPWDGPALLACSDGSKVAVILDRNGLRPFRYVITKDQLLVMASEVGVLDIPPEQVSYKGRIQPGRMFLVDTVAGKIIDDEELKTEIAGRRPYGKWLAENRVALKSLPMPAKLDEPDFASLNVRQKAFGVTQEELTLLLNPMAVIGKEAEGSMGTDTPLAFLSDKPQPLFSYFKQLFAQVSNPPLDAIREELVTSLESTIGSEQNLFEETPEHCRQLRLLSPILTNEEIQQIREIQEDGIKAHTLSTLFDIDSETGSLEAAMKILCSEASMAVREGYTILILSDKGMDANHAPIPSLLAVSGVHHHLIREGIRTKVGLVVESGDSRDVTQIALLIGYGAGAVNPYLAFESIFDMVNKGFLADHIDTKSAETNYVHAIEKGLLKIMSKMGISALQSYRGAQIFEAVGLGNDLVDRYFTWTSSRVGGIGIKEVELEARDRHADGYRASRSSGNSELDIGGYYQWRRGEEYHSYNPDTISKLQDAARTNSYATYKDFAEFSDGQGGRVSTLRGLMNLKFLDKPIPIDEVEPASEIVKRFGTGAISLGAISREAHEAMAIAMNSIGARSNTGEGGEDYRRFTPDPGGLSRNSATKQVASGRFGVTTNYLVNATDLQIKMAQGSKPGEGGRLPGHKVDDYIGWVRHTMPGVELISPPPHHDIYSIEDLAQLIHDLKNVNPKARIHVKLVAEVGVGIIAAGVSKGHGDVVLISGDNGGTGSSPQSSLKHAGLPWELGLAETQQVLVMNDLRSRIVVQTDGQLKTGRDVAIACLLGAEEFGFATAPLITLGCIMLRKCHLNTCSVGIATQDPILRKQFFGQPEHVVNYFFFVAEHLREIMAKMGFRTVNEMVGRMDRIEPSSAIEHWKTKGIDLRPLLLMPDVPKTVGTYCNEEQDHGLEMAIDNKLIELARASLEKQEPVNIELPIGNNNRTVCTMLSGEIAKRYGERGLPESTIRCKFKGSAGQSFGAFLAKGMDVVVEGDANDYFAKGISGGRVAIYPPEGSTFVAEKNFIVGNVVLYGATGGKVFIRGLAGERFSVRNSGAHTVVEGIGDHGCEYMTGGITVVLGQTGRNFAAGMSGGVAFILDEDGSFNERYNDEMVDLQSVSQVNDIVILKGLIEEHQGTTGSSVAKYILGNWDQYLKKFVKVMPRDYQRVLEELAAKGESRIADNGDING